jgi:hypothetical protein
MNNQSTGPEPTSEEQSRLRDYGAALRTVRAARSVFLTLLILSLLIHVGAFCVVRWGRVLESAKMVEGIVKEDVTAPATMEIDASPETIETVGWSSFWRGSLEALLPLAQFVGLVCCGLLAFCFFTSGYICLAGGLGGVRGSLSAFFWTLVLLALLFPWGRWLQGVQVPGVFFTFAELDNLTTDFANRLHEVLFYVRYLGYPLLALLIILVGDGRYSRGYRGVQRHLQTQLDVRTM